MAPPPWRRAWPAVALAALTLAVFWRLLLGEGLAADGSLVRGWQPWSDTPLASAVPRANDLLIDQYAFLNANEEFVSRWVRRGVWPLWNPDLAHGLPSIASIQTAEYYPTNLLLWPVPPFWSRGIRAILRIGLGLLGTFGLARAIGISRSGATLSAMAFGFCGFNVVWLCHPPSNVALLLPTMLWMLERLLQTGAYRFAAGLALAAGAALLGGHPPTVLHVSVPLAMWLGYRLLGFGGSARIGSAALGRRLVGIALAAGMIGSAALLPWLEYLPQNPSEKLERRVTRTLDATTLVTWVVPDFFGNPATDRDWLAPLRRVAGWNNFNERTGFVGVIPLLLGLGALLSPSLARRTAPFGLALLFSAVLIYDPPILGSLGRSLPGFRSANNSKLLCVAGFSLAMLAGLGFDRMLRHPRPARALPLWALACAVAGSLLASLWPTASEWERLRTPLQAASLPGAAEWLRLLDAAPAALRRDVAWAAVPMLAVAASLVLLQRGARRPARILLLAVCALDLWRFASPYNPTVPTRFAAPATAGIRYLQEHARDGRLLPIGGRLLPGNTLLRYELSDARGGDWINVREYEYLVTGRTGDFDFGTRLDALPRTVGALNVTHWVLPKGRRVPPDVEVVYDDELVVVRAAGLPRAFVASELRSVGSDAEARRLIESGELDLRRTVIVRAQDAARLDVGSAGPAGGSRATIVRSLPNRVDLDVETAAAGILVLVDTWLPGWECEIDGRPQPIVRANLAFRAVPVGPGRHQVVFRYRPRGARLGGLLAGTALLGIALGGVVLRFRDRGPRGSR